MATFIFECPRCKSPLEAEDEWEGMDTICPNCNAPVTCQKPGGAGPDPASPATGGGNACPSCGADLAADAVLCINCGYDTRIGKKL